jgi:hypothetical protein
LQSLGDLASTPVDVYVGARIRQRRASLGISQAKLGQGVRLTFQQIQKYESGANRIGSSRLYEFAKVLGVPVAYFFGHFWRDVTSTPMPVSRWSHERAFSDVAIAGGFPRPCDAGVSAGAYLVVSTSPRISDVVVQLWPS